jgi:hypothetical protein
MFTSQEFSRMIYEGQMPVEAALNRQEHPWGSHPDWMTIKLKLF